jgi:phosphatidylglycerophosphate synthase
VDKFFVLFFQVPLLVFNLLPNWVMVVLFAREIIATMMRCLACKHGVAMQTSLMAKMKSIILPIVLCIV